MRKSNLITVLIVVIIAIAGAVIYRTQFPAPAPEATLLPEGIGIAAAEAAVQALGNQGKVVLILPKRGNFKNPMVEVQQAAFAKTLARHKDLSLSATESIEVERPGTMGAGGMDPAEFQQLVQRHADATGFVSFADFPEFSKEALASLKGKKFIVVGGANPALKSLLTGGVVQAALVPRTKPAASNKKPGSAREWFSATHEVVTAANANSLP
jgi:hypothetical protein